LDQISMVKEQLVIFKRQVMDANLQNLIEWLSFKWTKIPTSFFFLLKDKFSNDFEFKKAGPIIYANKSVYYCMTMFSKNLFF
jgi:hypothetical protein